MSTDGGAASAWNSHIARPNRLGTTVAPNAAAAPRIMVTTRKRMQRVQIQTMTRVAVREHRRNGSELGLRLELTVDTHIHADHITGLGQLHKQTGCITAMGEMTQAE